MKQGCIHYKSLYRKQVSDELWSDICHSIPAKNKSFYLSRLALRDLTNALGHNLDTWQSYQLTNFHQLSLLPQLTFSLSHTKDFAIVAASSIPSFIGVDCEYQDRNMKPGTEKYFKHPEDDHEGSALELWSIKEAAFKAFSNAGHPIKLLKEIVIKKGQATFKSEKVVQIQQKSLDNLIISFATTFADTEEINICRH